MKAKNTSIKCRNESRCSNLWFFMMRKNLEISTVFYAIILIFASVRI